MCPELWWLPRAHHVVTWVHNMITTLVITNEMMFITNVMTTGQQVHFIISSQSGFGHKQMERKMTARSSLWVLKIKSCVTTSVFLLAKVQLKEIFWHFITFENYIAISFTAFKTLWNHWANTFVELDSNKFLLISWARTNVLREAINLVLIWSVSPQGDQCVNFQ